MKIVLVTGSTGVIGSAVTRLLLRDEQTELRVVLRAHSKDHLEERVQWLLQFCGFDPANPTSTKRLQAFVGDVSQPRLGLERAAYSRLVGEVTHIVHAAGNVKLNQSLEDARRSAVESTRQLLAFADAGVRKGTLRKLEYVSTVGVAGRLHGVVPERPLTEPREFRNTYEAAKAEAEDTVLAELCRGVPATVHRPSMLVGDSQTGHIINFQVFYYLCEWLSGQRTWGIVPDAGDVALDIIPVDYVARAIALVLERGDAIGKIFHLCSGPTQAIPINTLSERLRDIFGRRRGRRVRLRRVSPAVIRRLSSVAAALAPLPARRALQTIPFFLAYLDEPQCFDDARSRAFLMSNGLVVPAPETYLDKILEYYFSERARQAR